MNDVWPARITASADEVASGFGPLNHIADIPTNQIPGKPANIRAWIRLETQDPHSAGFQIERLEIRRANEISVGGAGAGVAGGFPGIVQGRRRHRSNGQVVGVQIYEAGAVAREAVG